MGERQLLQALLPPTAGGSEAKAANRHALDENERPAGQGQARMTPSALPEWQENLRIKKSIVACPRGQAMSRPNKLDHSDTLQQKYA